MLLYKRGMLRCCSGVNNSTAVIPVQSTKTSPLTKKIIVRGGKEILCMLGGDGICIPYGR